MSLEAHGIIEMKTFFKGEDGKDDYYKLLIRHDKYFKNGDPLRYDITFFSSNERYFKECRDCTVEEFAFIKGEPSNLEAFTMPKKDDPDPKARERYQEIELYEMYKFEHFPHPAVEKVIALKAENKQLKIEDVVLKTEIKRLTDLLSARGIQGNLFEAYNTG
jgi:hypothetical protein